jgi:hypothetical protein
MLYIDAFLFLCIDTSVSAATNMVQRKFFAQKGRHLSIAEVPLHAYPTLAEKNSLFSGS